MKKISLNLRLFGEDGSDGTVAGDGTQNSGESGTVSDDCAAEQSKKEKNDTGRKEKAERKTQSSTAPVGGEGEEEAFHRIQKESVPDESAGIDVQPPNVEAEGMLEDTVLIGDKENMLPPGAMRIIQSLAAAYQMQETDIDGIADAFSRIETKNALEERLRRRNATKQYQALLCEAETLSKKIRGFDLETELSDRRFRGMLRAGFSMEEAWQAVHLDQLLSAAIRQASEKGAKEAVERFRREATRPDENGVKGQSGISRKPGVENLTGRGIRDILRRVENGAKVKF